ncbi:MAG: PTS sugar transporter subunit IIB [Elusimicrobiota bacterium]
MDSTPWLRIDDRLIHGQVVEGWAPHLKATRIVVVSDEVASDETQRMLMRLAVPDEISIEALSVKEACARIAELEANGSGLLILTPAPREALALLEAGMKVASVNVGGLHHSVGRVMIGKAIFLTEGDREALQAIAARGVRLDARAVPSEKGIPLAQMLEGHL